MEFFFNPKGIAVVGATANKLKGGFAESSDQGKAENCFS